MNVRTVIGWRERQYQAKANAHRQQFERAKKTSNASLLGKKARSKK